MRLKSLFRALRIAAVWTVILLMSFDTALACKLFFMKLPVCHSTYVSAPLRSCYPVDCCPAPTSYCELGSAWNYADHGVVISPPADCGTHQTVVEASPPEEVDCDPVEEGSTTSITEPEGVEHAPEAPIPELTQDEPSDVGLVVPDAPDDVLDTAPEADVSGIDEENLADDPAVPNAVEPALLEEDLVADDALLGDVADDPADDLLDVEPVDEGDGLGDLFDEGAAPADEDDGLGDLFDEGAAPADEDDGLGDLFDEGAAPADEDDGLGDLFDEGAAPADEDDGLEDLFDEGAAPADEDDGLGDLFDEGAAPADEDDGLGDLFDEGAAPADEDDGLGDLFDEGAAPADEDDGLEDLFDEGAAPADEDDGLGDLFDEGAAPADEDDGLEDLFDEGAAPADEDDGLEDLFDEGAAPADEDADLFDDSDVGEEPVDDEEGDDLEDLFNQNLPAIETENLVEARPAPADANDNRVVEVSVTSAASRDALPVRQWTDNTGLFSTVGRLIEVSPESVRLLKDNGRNTTVAWYRLSDADQEYVRHVAAIFDDTVAAQLAER